MRHQSESSLAPQHTNKIMYQPQKGGFTQTKSLSGHKHLNMYWRQPTEKSTDMRTEPKQKSKYSSQLLNILNFMSTNGQKTWDRRSSMGDMNAQDLHKIRKNMSLTEMPNKINLKTSDKFHTNQTLPQKSETREITQQHKVTLQKVLQKLSQSTFQQAIVHYDDFFRVLEDILSQTMTEPMQMCLNESNGLVKFSSFSDVIHETFTDILRHIQNGVQLSIMHEDLNLKLQQTSDQNTLLANDVMKLLNQNKELASLLQKMETKLAFEIQEFRLREQQLLGQILDLTKSVGQPTLSTTQKLQQKIKTRIKSPLDTQSNKEVQNLLQAQFHSIQKFMQREELIKNFLHQYADGELYDLLIKYLAQSENQYKQDNMVVFENQKHHSVPRQKLSIHDSSLADNSVINESDESSFDFAWKKDMSASENYYKQGAHVMKKTQILDQK